MTLEHLKKLSLMNAGLICMFAGFLFHGALIGVGMVLIFIDIIFDSVKEAKEAEKEE